MKKRTTGRQGPGRDSICLLPILLCLLLTACRVIPSNPSRDAQTAGTQSLAAESAVPADTDSKARQSKEAGKKDGSGDPLPAQQDPARLAALVSEQYGVRILLGEDVPLVYKDYTAACLDDPEKTAAALTVLDSTLSVFPPGFFASVKEGYCDSISICLAQDLHAVNDDHYIESAYAFTTVQDNTIWLVLNAARPLQRGILIHELTHVIDYRLLGMQQLPEEEWNRLNPPSFSYYNSYLDEKGTDLRLSGSQEYTALSEEDPDRIWFCDSYSKTFAMEDRARLMESLMDPDDISDRLFSSPHVRTKLRFYFYILRQAFENSRWPEETAWEAALRKVS